MAGTHLESFARYALKRKAHMGFSSSSNYWEERYRKGGTSGTGSYGRIARFKAEVLNDFVSQNGITSVIEFGSGDGNQLALAEYPAYVGVDISETAVRACRERFAEDPSKSFVTVSRYDGQVAELTLSLDVIYHLVEDETYETYMKSLFDASERFVIIYGSDKDLPGRWPHVRHRKFTDWVATNRPGFKLTTKIPARFPFDPDDRTNTSDHDFFIFKAVR